MYLNYTYDIHDVMLTGKEKYLCFTLIYDKPRSIMIVTCSMWPVIWIT